MVVPDRWTETLWTTGHQLRFQKANESGQVGIAVLDLMCHNPNPNPPYRIEGDRVVILTIELVSELMVQAGYEHVMDSEDSPRL